MNKISILICTIPSRTASFGRLITELRSQMLIYAPAVGIISNASTDLSIGAKRNWLLEKAESEYLCFIDDDDMISRDYIDLLMKAADSGKDCASLKGNYYFNGNFDAIFEHSIKYKKWETVDAQIKYLRYPNHLNLIKTSIAKQFEFSPVNHGEDHDWSTRIHQSGLLKTEHYIDHVIYNYYKVSKR